MDERELKIRLQVLQMICEEFQFELYEWSKIRTDKFLFINGPDKQIREHFTYTFWELIKKGNNTGWIPIGTRIVTPLVIISFYGKQISPKTQLKHTVVEIDVNTNNNDNKSS